MTSPIRRVIVGTAGHIDHGKSTLVRRLTGVDPDRLEEEKARGMTIDLGFAPYRTAAGTLVGIIDVPGHERFVKNMVAGASSVDLFLLVVAADDGVMPQTREHVDILDLLGARRGVVALTKTDLVDEEMMELALADLSEYLSETPFSDAPVIPVSGATGEGIDRLRAELDRRVEEIEERAAEGLFRMPIQRVFTKKGHGTVLTGVPISGRVAVGDAVEVLPRGGRGRVRAIQAYREVRDEAFAGHSTALNVSDVDHRDVRRGDVVATPGYFHPVRFLEARLRTLRSVPRPLRHGDSVRLHVGTSEVLARVALLDRDEVEPGGEVFAQFRLREPIVVCHGDRFLVRQVSPMTTWGGGVLVSESERRRGVRRSLLAESTRRRAEVLGDAAEWLLCALLDRAAQPADPAQAALLVKRPREEAARLLEELADEGRVVRVGRERYLHREVFDDAVRALEGALDEEHRRRPLAAWVDGGSLRRRLDLPDAIFEAVIEHLAEVGRVERRKGGLLRRQGHEPRLDERQRRAMARLDAALEAAGARPPAAAELARTIGVDRDMLDSLCAVLEAEGRIFRAGEHWFHGSLRARLLAALRSVAARHGGELVVPEVRDELGTTRKFLIPLLERLDSEGVTMRRGDRRFVVASALEGGAS